MAKLPSFPLYAQDFDMDTNTWRNEEIGVYLRLLLSEWINGPLPEENRKLAKIARISPKKFSNLFQNISHKFISNGNGFLINPRMEKEREKLLNYLESKKIAGKKGAEKRWKKDSTTNGTPNAYAIANPMAKLWPSSSFSYNKEGNKLPSCPHGKIIDLYHEILPELSPVKQWNETRSGYLRARWKEDKKRQDLDWWKKYFEYVKGVPFLMGKNNRGWQANLEWLIRPRNFVKVIEGYYERL